MPYQVILELAAKGKTFFLYWSCLSLKFWYFIHHGFFCINYDFNKHCIKIFFVLIISFWYPLKCYSWVKCLTLLTLVPVLPTAWNHLAFSPMGGKALKQEVDEDAGHPKTQLISTTTCGRLYWLLPLPGMWICPAFLLSSWSSGL